MCFLSVHSGPLLIVVESGVLAAAVCAVPCLRGRYSGGVARPVVMVLSLADRGDLVLQGRTGEGNGHGAGSPQGPVLVEDEDARFVEEVRRAVLDRV